MRSIIKSIGKECKFDEDELKLLYNVVKEEHLLSWRHRLGVSARHKMMVLTERPRPDPCAQSQYRLDYDLFAEVFPRLLPWPVSEVFVIRVFRFLDISDSGLLTFRDLARTLSILLLGEATDKLALFYKCHLPPAFNMSDLDGFVSEPTPKEGLEVATEATDLIVTRPSHSRSLSETTEKKSKNTNELRTRCSTSSAILMPSTSQTGGNELSSEAESLIDLIAAKSIGSCPSVNEKDRIHMGDVASDDSYSLVDESIEKLKQLRQVTLNSSDATSTRLEMKMLPEMNQIQFIQLWKTFYDLLSGKETEQNVFHSLAVTGTLLLQLGETHKQLQEKLELEIACAIKDVEVEEKKVESEEDEEDDDVYEDDRKIDPTEEQRRRIGDMKTCIDDDEWRVNLEQIMASVMAESDLAEFFEKKFKLENLVKKYYDTRFAKTEE